jgi:hypothetical protein
MNIPFRKGIIKVSLFAWKYFLIYHQYAMRSVGRIASEETLLSTIAALDIAQHVT